MKLGAISLVNRFLNALLATLFIKRCDSNLFLNLAQIVEKCSSSYKKFMDTLAFVEQKTKEIKFVARKRVQFRKDSLQKNLKKAKRVKLSEASG